MVAEQLKEIQRLKETVAIKERTNTELEKKVLLQSSPDRSPKKQSYSGKEIDDLGDQIRTKEEEIQILWNVIKEINKTKGNALNIGQLQKLLIRSEAHNSQNAQEHQTIFATPNHPRF